MDLTTVNFETLKGDLLKSFKQISSVDQLNSLKTEWLSKDGELKKLFQQLRLVEGDRKAVVATELNSLKVLIENFCEEKESEFQSQALNEKIKGQFIDLSLPGSSPGVGRRSPIAEVERRMLDVIKRFGFRSVFGPEIEEQYFCFDALNIPKHHPARDMQDTFYVEGDLVLRTHTTSVQARVLKEVCDKSEQDKSIKIASFGRVYRNETEDANHGSMFHQFDLVWVEAGLTLSNLQALITHILKELYGKRRKVRFIPKFYPYTEPSIGAQIDCSLCKGAGCPACNGSGWGTIGGAGMIHRNVLLEFKFDPDKVSGFAFGLGTDRIASQFSHIPKLKMFYDGDVRVLKNV